MSQHQWPRTAASSLSLVRNANSFGFALGLRRVCDQTVENRLRVAFSRIVHNRRVEEKGQRVCNAVKRLVARIAHARKGKGAENQDAKDKSHMRAASWQTGIVLPTSDTIRAATSHIPESGRIAPSPIGDICRTTSRFISGKDSARPGMGRIRLV